MKVIAVLCTALALVATASAFTNDCLSLEPYGAWSRPNLAAKKGLKAKLDLLQTMVVEEFIAADSSNSTVACPDDFVTTPSKACYSASERSVWRLIFDVTCPDFKSHAIRLDATVFVPGPKSHQLPQVTELKEV